MTRIYASQPKLHRENIVSVDAADPPDKSGAVECHGYNCCRFDISLGGVDLDSLEVQALFWNERLQQWFGGASRIFESAGKHALVVECHGAAIFLKVTAFSGGSFDLSADYILS